MVLSARGRTVIETQCNKSLIVKTDKKKFRHKSQPTKYMSCLSWSRRTRNIIVIWSTLEILCQLIAKIVYLYKYQNGVQSQCLPQRDEDMEFASWIFISILQYTVDLSIDRFELHEFTDNIATDHHFTQLTSILIFSYWMVHLQGLSSAQQNAGFLTSSWGMNVPILQNRVKN